MSLRGAAIFSLIFLWTGLSPRPSRGQTIVGRLLDGESVQPVPGAAPSSSGVGGRRRPRRIEPCRALRRPGQRGLSDASERSDAA
jgi:hypothetical protein